MGAVCAELSWGWMAQRIVTVEGERVAFSTRYMIPGILLHDSKHTKIEVVDLVAFVLAGSESPNESFAIF